MSISKAQAKDLAIGLLEESAALHDQIRALQINTRCKEHQGNLHNLYCSVCGKPYAATGSQPAQTYKELLTENKILQEAVNIFHDQLETARNG
jgi:hypothetical protein